MISQSVLNNSFDSNDKDLQKYENLPELKRIKQREAEKTEQIEELLQKNQILIKKNKDLESDIERKKAKIQELKQQNSIFEKRISNFSLEANTPKFKPQRSNSFDKSNKKDLEQNKPFSKWADKEPEKSQQPYNKWKDRLIMESRIQNGKIMKDENLSKTDQNQKKEEKSFVSETHTEIVEAFESKIQKLKSEVKKLKSKDEEIEGLREEKKTLTERVDNLKKKLKETKKNLKNKNSEIENFEVKVKELTKKNTELEDKLEQSKKFKEKWKNIKQEFSEFKSHFNLKENKKSNKKSSKKNLPFLTYDLIINIDSLKSQKIGWDIWINQDSVQKINNSLSNNTIIGLVGGENIGKTFILNKLCGFQLPSGANVHTKGLSMKISDAANNNLIVLDSAGIQTPVYYFDEKLMKRFSINKEDLNKKDEIKRQMINDRTITDTFIQDFILDVCEVILIVVGQLNQNDQKFIERITWKYQIKKRIIVVHNFSNLFSIEDVNQRIEMDIIRAFNTIPRLIPNTDIYEYIERKEESNKENVSHLVLGVDWSESGSKFNEFTFEYIKKIIDTRLERRNLNLIEKLKDFFQKNHAKYLRFKQKPKKIPFLEEDKDKKGLLIKSNESYEIPNPIFDAFGDLITSPPYEVFERKTKFVSLIEIPDLNIDSLKLSLERKETDFCCLMVEGVKNWSELTEKKIVNVSGNRSCGEFKCKIPLGPAYFKYKFISEKNEERYRYENGILIVEVRIIKEEEEKL